MRRSISIRRQAPTRISFPRRINYDNYGKKDNEILPLILTALAKSIEKKKKGKRKNFTKKTRDLKLKQENHRCESCWKYTEYPEFHHKDGDPSNNHISNCKLLCPNCHAKKTRKS